MLSDALTPALSHREREKGRTERSPRPFGERVRVRGKVYFISY
jgi:hypothetical protein